MLRTEPPPSSASAATAAASPPANRYHFLFCRFGRFARPMTSQMGSDTRRHTFHPYLLFSRISWASDDSANAMEKLRFCITHREYRKKPKRKKTLIIYVFHFSHHVRSLIQPAVDFMCSLFVSLSQFSQTVIGSTLDGTLFALFRFRVNIDADSDVGAHAALLKICSVSFYIKLLAMRSPEQSFPRNAMCEKTGDD